MDETDLKILRELNKDARTPFRKIAKKLGVTTQTVINRYNRLKEADVIQFCSISINLEKIGYRGSALLLISSLPESNLSETMELVKKTKNVILATKTIGDFEGYAVLVFEDIKDLYKTVLQIKSLPAVGNVEVSFTLPGITTFPRSRNMV